MCVACKQKGVQVRSRVVVDLDLDDFDKLWGVVTVEFCVKSYSWKKK